jgi:translation initiation factor IF-2
MSEPGKEPGPKPQAAASGWPPVPSRAGAPRKTVYLLDPMEVKDLASALGLKPFKVIADLMELKLFKAAHDTVDFETASRVAHKHGYRAERPPPGMLVL